MPLLTTRKLSRKPEELRKHGSRPVLLIDVRSEEQYQESHLLHAFHLPAQAWLRSSDELLSARRASNPETATIQDTEMEPFHYLAAHLHQLMWHKIVEYFLLSTEGTNPSHLGKFRDQAPAIAVYHDEAGSQELQAMCSLLEKAMRDESVFDATDIENFNRVHVFPEGRGFSLLEQKSLKGGFYPVYRAGEVADEEPLDRDSIRTLLDGVLYYGPASVFYQYVEKKADQSETEIRHQALEEKLHNSWTCVDNILDLRYNSSIPKFLQLTYSTAVKGKRAVESRARGGLRQRTMRLFGIARDPNLVETLEDDDNVEKTTYKIDNGLTFHVIRGTIIDKTEPTVLFDTIHRSIEELLDSRGALLVQPAPYAISVLMVYLVRSRLWSVRYALRFLSRTLTVEELAREGEQLIIPVLHLLEFEKCYLPHAYPSVPFHVLALFFLGMEGDLHQMLAECRNEDLVRRKNALFAAIEQGQVKEVKSLLTQPTDRDKGRKLSCSLNLVRRQVKFGPLHGSLSDGEAAEALVKSRSADDATPLLVALQEMRSHCRNDEHCLRALAQGGAINLTDKFGRDALYYALQDSPEIAHSILDASANINTCSKTERTNPLQKALGRRYPCDLLSRLSSPETINHLDAKGLTPSHWAVAVGYSDDELKKIMENLLRKGANFYLRDVNGLTVLNYATLNRSEEFCAWLEKLVSEASIRYEPYLSFAALHPSINMNYYIDGENYYPALAAALNQAEKSVYIAGWWFTPEIYLTRTEDGLEDRLDKLLIKLAVEGVQVRIMVWNNIVEDLRNCDAVQRMAAYHDNIQGMSHSSALTAGYSHHQKIVCIDDRDAFVGGLDLCLHRWDRQTHPISPCAEYPGKEYFNPRYLGDKTHANNDVGKFDVPYEGLKNNDLPRMGWHDIHCRVDGPAAADVSRNFIQRWNHVCSASQGARVVGCHPIDPCPVPPPSPFERREGAFEVKVQVTRSISSWAIGTSTTERSITNAIRHAITNAESFVYIETQFFISVQADPSVFDPHTGQVESLADVIVNRIRQAVIKKEKFKIIMVLPMFPEGDPTRAVTQQIMQEQLKTIEYIQSQVNLLTRGTMEDHEDYIRFYSLGNVAYLQNRIVVEQIYIHAKLLITDRHVIIGSANLNMRSLAGDRDTEIAVAAESPEMASSLRRDLWREHLGEKAVITDSVLNDVEQWEAIAESNTRILRKVFKSSCPMGAPRNKQEFRSYDAAFIKDVWSDVASEEIFERMTSQLQGHVVQFPQHFLEEDVRAILGVRASIARGDFVMLALQVRRDIVQ